MAPSVRTPLLARPLPHQSPSTHGRIRSAVPALKRTRSPDPSADSRVKRTKASTSAQADVLSGTKEERLHEREERRLQREAQRDEFRVKYRKAFPHWRFHFDADVTDKTTLERLTQDIEHFHGTVDDFFSNDITHLITNAPVIAPASSFPSTAENKENTLKMRPSASRAGSLLKSPHGSKTRVVEEDSFVTANTILAKAQEFGIKIWSVTKLESVIERCLTPVEREEPPHPLDHGHVHPPTRTLSTLLAQEKVHGTTERDPSQRRHDYRYFSKGAYFVLVEDIKQELATLVAAEYMPSRGRDGRERRTWPELFCHPKARGPFIEFDDREQRRWERQERAAQQKAQAEEQAEARRAMARAQSRARAELEAKKNGDLRRSVSMVNLQRHASGPDSVFQVPVADDPGDLDESAHASGFLASGAYLAASGNSFSVTSTTGTTSAADFSHRSLPTGLRGKLQHEVLIKRRASGMIDAEHSQATGSAMAPPADIPERRRAMLRKARSTNTLKLPPKAEATVRPGYCESCRVKFQDFPQHVKSGKHRKFAANDANFAQLDAVLSRVRRRTLAEAEEAHSLWESRLASAETDDMEFQSDDPSLLDHFGDAEDENELYENALS